jgi:hypothetical protein
MYLEVKMKLRRLQVMMMILCLVPLVACTGTPGQDTEPTPAAADTPVATPTLQAGATAPAATPTTGVTEPAASPTVEATTAATATAGGTATAFCPEVPRPALLLFIPGQKYVVVDPQSGQSCDLPFPDPLPGILQVANGSLYYHMADGDNLTIKRLSPGGTAEVLAYTTVNKVERSLFESFAVSPDGRYIAWSAAGSQPDEPGAAFSDLWVAELATGQITAHLPDFTSADEGARSLVPARFSDDGSTLFYTRQPVGIGGSWIAFVGRYDNLFSTPTSGGAVTPIFDCAPLGLFLCLGDFYQLEGQVSTLAYVNDQTHEVVILNGQGDTLNTLPVEAEFVGFPTIGPTAELVFYSATLGESFPNPTQAALHRVAPPTAPAEVVISDPNLLLPERFLDGGRVVVRYVVEGSTWGTAVVDLMTGTLQPLPQWPDAFSVGVLP